MEDDSHTRRSNPNPKSNFGKQGNNRGSEKKKSEFVFCKVCRLNHDQGLRHKYFPKHKSSLSAFLSRFKTKIDDVLFFMKNPTILRHEHAPRNRFWCVFCDADVDELDSSFSCENAINHLASARHLKNLKHFLWQYGGGMDCLDAFRVLDADIAKWEKNCKSLKTEAVDASKGSSEVPYGSSNDIHRRLNNENITNIDQNTVNHLQSNHLNPVNPLQYHTYEYQISHSGVNGVANIGTNHHGVTVCSALDTYSDLSLSDSNELRGNGTSQQCLFYNGGICSGNNFLSYGGAYQPYQDGSTVHGEDTSTQGLQTITQVASITIEQAGGNVHTGAPPPWFETTDETLLDGHVRPVSVNFDSPNKSGKSQKLNPQRVGAAWAEKRKMELEKEKKGEFVKNEFDDANWLPNFGRVWQSGSRKESRKEFEKEKQKLLKVVNDPEIPVNIEPYVSKRMRSDGDEQ
ncbi:hypothetical protein SLEP1_g17488 [Rubroshorea leprosula]|uniref:Coiled-coil domain-containing protein 84 n=1 Tax=Rubroshorea leprosula TaxID=152421 RepID=A0AAV5J665_9ROSI|nr:hypothetical protein SLEP1_g17488 [Rubroshorea leprosula]